jgi:diguanylate cyclase (GGDEF)-like protein/PAS domain S-box-containing protein
MRKILLIETSATLRHALKKMLLSHGYEVTVVGDFSAGLERLTTAGEATVDGVVLGWPSRTQTSTDELLTTLGESEFAELPLLVLAHEADSGKLGWVSGRMHTAFLLWENYQDAVKTLPQLLNRQAAQPCYDANTETPIRILLVDDSPTARVKFRKLLDRAGYETATAATAEEAMARALEEPFDIAIIDYFMPDKNGDALCRELRTNPRTANIMPAVLTSTYLDKVIQTSLAAGAVECMFKNEADDLFSTRVGAMSRTIRITKRIEQERTRLDGILSSVGDGVYGVNTEGLIAFANPATCQLLGFESEMDLIGQHPTTLFHKYEGANEQIGTIDQHYLEKAIRDGKQLHGVESIFTRTDGTPIQVELTIFPLHIDGEQEGAVVAFRDVSVRKLLEEELKWQANHDPLTKLLNRKYLEDALEHEVQRLQRSEEQSALLYIDLDRFKYINDTIGHTAGDQLLIEIGDLLQTRLRKSDLLGRLGGDEFGILLRDVDEHSVREVAEKFRNLLADYVFVRNGRDYHINGSIGIAMIDQDTVTPGEVLSNADIACHMAKGRGRNQSHVYTPEADDKAAMDLELGWSFRLHKALEKNTFKLYYQPIIALQDIDIDALPQQSGVLWQQLMDQGGLKQHTYEVLLRLHNSYGEPISPNAFLPTAERFNMMQKIDRWVINAAMEQMAQLRERQHDVTFTINLSGQSMDPANLVPLFHEGIEKWNIEPERFLFEITESCAINDTHSACNLIDELNNLGCRFALDDFGSGYCSFSHLKRLPVEYIKIDGMFVKDILNDPMDVAIVRSITNIAHTLGKKTIAEFVESADALKMLRDCGVDYVQGYYIATPMAELPARQGPDAEQQMR